MQKRTIAILLIIATLMFSCTIFVRSRFGALDVKYERITSHPQDEEDRFFLIHSPKKITFLEDTIQLKAREHQVNFAIRNIHDRETKFTLREGLSCHDSTSNQEHLISFDTYAEYTIEGNSSKVLPFIINVDPKADRGIFKCKLDLYEVDSTALYASKDFLIEYRP